MFKPPVVNSSWTEVYVNNLVPESNDTSSFDLDSDASASLHRSRGALRLHRLIPDRNKRENTYQRECSCEENVRLIPTIFVGELIKLPRVPCSQKRLFVWLGL